MEKGWVSDFIPDRNPSPPYADGNAGVGKTLEYSWDDYCLATYAKKLGKEDDYQMFLKRAHNYQNVFDASVGFMRGIAVRFQGALLQLHDEGGVRLVHPLACAASPHGPGAIVIVLHF